MYHLHTKEINGPHLRCLQSRPNLFIFIHTKIVHQRCNPFHFSASMMPSKSFLNRELLCLTIQNYFPASILCITASGRWIFSTALILSNWFFPWNWIVSCRLFLMRSISDLQSDFCWIFSVTRCFYFIFVKQDVFILQCHAQTMKGDMYSMMITKN